MADSVFCDTNVLLRAYHDTFPEHEAAKTTFDAYLEQGKSFWISRQVIREYLVQITHPRTFEEPYDGARAANKVHQILKTCLVADETSLTTEHLLTLLQDYPVSGKQIHDANVVATMLAHNIDTLLTLNTMDFNRYEDKITLVSPLE